MFNISGVDFQKAIEVLKKDGYKIVIFFLYSDNQNSEYYYYRLTERFEELNQNTGKQMAFLTNYSVNSSMSKDYVTNDNPFMGRGWTNNRREIIQQRMMGNPSLKNPYTSMKNVAKAIGPDIENKFPCFVILDPNDLQFFVVKSAGNLEPCRVFSEASHIITDIQDVNYDIHEYAKNFNQQYYYLSASVLLEQNLKSIKYGVNVQELLEVIRSEKLEDYFNIELIQRLSYNGYISLKVFFNNWNRIQYKNTDESHNSISGFIDKYLSYFWTDYRQNRMMFPAIRDYIEPSSRDYLCIANRFKKGDMADFITKYSMTAVCLGKVVEDEMNLGIFNVFRGAFRVSLPQYFDKVQSDLGRIFVEFNRFNENFLIDFNKGINNRSCKLQYPEVNRLRKIAFDPDCHPLSNVESITNARDDIKKIKEWKSRTVQWGELLTNLSTIARARNQAIHRAVPLREEELDNCISAFKSIVSVHFFEVNSQLKKIKRNQ